MRFTRGQQSLDYKKCGFCPSKPDSVSINLIQNTQSGTQDTDMSKVTAEKLRSRPSSLNVIIIYTKKKEVVKVKTVELSKSQLNNLSLNILVKILKYYLRCAKIVRRDTCDLLHVYLSKGEGSLF